MNYKKIGGRFAAILLLLCVFSGAVFFAKWLIKPKEDYNLAGGNPDIINNPFETRHNWFVLGRLDGQPLEEHGLTPDQFYIDVDFEPRVVKFANGSYRITLKVKK
jgi:hypothetical protein